MILRSRARESSALPTAFLRPRWTKTTSGGVFASGEGASVVLGLPQSGRRGGGELPGTYGMGRMRRMGQWDVGRGTYGKYGTMGLWDYAILACRYHCSIIHTSHALLLLKPALHKTITHLQVAEKKKLQY